MALESLRINSTAVRRLMRTPGVAAEVQRVAAEIDAATRQAGSETKTDYEMGSQRPRSAVIAGYERGATPESSRNALLRGLDGAR